MTCVLQIQCATDLSKSLVTVEEELSVLYDEVCANISCTLIVVNFMFHVDIVV